MQAERRAHKEPKSGTSAWAVAAAKRNQQQQHQQQHHQQQQQPTKKKVSWHDSRLEEYQPEYHDQY
eukprot:8260503-Alexandrium_andersonii.AAC.1